MVKGANMIEQLFGGSNETINILGGIGFFAVVLITVYVMWVYIRKIKSEKSEGKLAEENWDGIGEYKNDLPTGWTVVTILLIIWAGWYYLIGYPVNSYSQIGEWNQENNEYKAKFQSTWENVDADTLKQMGESIYLAKCSSCHGLTADGMDGKAQNLTDPMYQYYGVEGIEAAIRAGKKGMIGEMPSFEKEGTMTAVQYKAVSTYVLSLSK
jgi:cytochrome c oxidase cbb3-type subunit 3